MLSRGLASGGLVGSANAVWAVKRTPARSSVSYTLNTSASFRAISGK